MAKVVWGVGSLTSTYGASAEDAPTAQVETKLDSARVARPTVGPVTADLPRSVPRPRPPVALDEPKARRQPAADDRSRSNSFALPTAVRSVSFGRRLWLAVAFVAPVILGALYLFFVAPDEYLTEYHFSVRVPIGQPQGSTGASGGALSALFGGNPSPGADTLDNFTVVDYARSAQAARDLDAKIGLRAMFAKPADPLSKLSSTANAEALAKYWRSMVFSSYDVTTGLAVVRVKAYTASDSYAIANNLINLSSDLVNSIGTRSQQDNVRFAQQQLDRANAQVVKLRSELADLRRRTNVVDPSKSAVAINDTLVSDLIGRRAQAQAQLQLMVQTLHNAQAPQVALIQRQIDAIDDQLRSARASGGAEKGRQNIAVTVGEFEAVNNKLVAAQSVLAAAVQALGTAQTSAESQRLYLTTYVHPVQPESPQEPERWHDLLIIVLVAGMVWIIGRLIGNSIMEHA